MLSDPIPPGHYYLVKRGKLGDFESLDEEDFLGYSKDLYVLVQLADSAGYILKGRDFSGRQATAYIGLRQKDELEAEAGAEEEDREYDGTDD